MHISILLALKDIRSDHKSGFVKTASILSVFGLSIGISALLITLFILNGFERVISDKITQIDGHIRIKHFLSEPFNPSGYDFINELSNTHPEIKGIYLAKNSGKGFALKSGFQEVTGDLVLIQDADLEYDPKDYEALINPFKNTDADVVYGSRFMGG